MDKHTRMLKLARRYTWWKSPEEAMQFSQQVYARIMDMGTFEDVQELESIIGAAELQKTLERAEIGQFRPRSWTYWQARLNNLIGAQVPQLPARRFL